MSKNNSKNKINIPDPKAEIGKLIESSSKFKLGEKGYNFFDIKQLKPKFAFDYVSLLDTHLCFNSNKLNTEDFHQLFNGLKRISDKTYEELRINKYYRFHPIDLNDPKVSIKDSDLIKALGSPKNVSSEDLPSLYQFDLLFEEARAAGFLFKGTFYLIWFDRFHKIYPSN